MTNDELERCVDKYRREKHRIKPFAESVRSFFAEHPVLSSGNPPILHSIRMRLKDDEHLRDKIRRKWSKGDSVTVDNLLTTITDLAGVRLLHLYQQQYQEIHEVIADQLRRRDWVLLEDPVAYTWDPECTEFFQHCGLSTKVKESFYTSIHFVLKPRDDSPICCELQVRTLFEEIWGEVDHWINYPHPTDIATCREQIRVLSKLVGAGTRLTDSIFRAHYEHRGGTEQHPPNEAPLPSESAPTEPGPAGAQEVRP